METTFTKTDKGKYVEVTYHTGIEGLSYNLKDNASQWVSNNSDADVFINKVKQIEKIVFNKLNETNLNYNVSLILLTYMKLLESISSGFDIRSKLSNDEIADLIIRGYDDKYKKALEFCQNTINVFNNTGKKDGYLSNFRMYDEHNRLVKEFMFEFIVFKDTDFDVNLETLNKEASDFLNMLIEKNKNA